MKELAQLDGAFATSEAGVAISASRYIDTFSYGLNVPLGFKSSQWAAAATSNRGNAVSVMVSESGELVSEITAELWMWGRYSSHLSDNPTSTQAQDRVTVVSVE